MPLGADEHRYFCDRATVMKNGSVVGTVRMEDVTQDDVLQMIIQGKPPAAALAA